MKKGEPKVFFLFFHPLHSLAAQYGHRALVSSDDCSLYKLCIKRTTVEEKKMFVFAPRGKYPFNGGKVTDER